MNLFTDMVDRLRVRFTVRVILGALYDCGGVLILPQLETLQKAVESRWIGTVMGGRLVLAKPYIRQVD
jgi:hypothetical protein